MRVIGIKASERVYLVSEGRQLVGALDHFQVVLLRAVSLVVERIDVIEERGVRILRYEIVQTLDQRCGNFLSGARLVSVVFRHRVFGRPCVLTRCGRLRDSARPVPKKSGKAHPISRVPSISVLRSFRFLLAQTPSLSFLLPVHPGIFCRESHCFGKPWDYRETRALSARRSLSLT